VYQECRARFDLLQKGGAAAAADPLARATKEVPR
jgi:hypothetical protein